MKYTTPGFENEWFTPMKLDKRKTKMTARQVADIIWQDAEHKRRADQFFQGLEDKARSFAGAWDFGYQDDSAEVIQLLDRYEALVEEIHKRMSDKGINAVSAGNDLLHSRMFISERQNDLANLWQKIKNDGLYDDLRRLAGWQYQQSPSRLARVRKGYYKYFAPNGNVVIIEFPDDSEKLMMIYLEE